MTREERMLREFILGCMPSKQMRPFVFANCAVDSASEELWQLAYGSRLRCRPIEFTACLRTPQPNRTSGGKLYRYHGGNRRKSTIDTVRCFSRYGPERGHGGGGWYSSFGKVTKRRNPGFVVDQSEIFRPYNINSICGCTVSIEQHFFLERSIDPDNAVDIAIAIASFTGTNSGSYLLLHQRKHLHFTL